MSPRSGLSLFELLISLALLAVIAAGLAGAFGLGVRLYDRTAAIEATTEPVVLRVRLRNLLAEATSPRQLTTLPIAFAGGADGFSFVTVEAHDFFPQAAAARVEVRFDEQQLSLVLTALDDDGSDVQTITGHLATSDFWPAFAYLDTRSDTPVWNSTWTDDNRLPALVRVEIPEGSTPDWPEFTVRLRNTDEF